MTDILINLNFYKLDIKLEVCKNSNDKFIISIEY